MIPVLMDLNLNPPWTLSRMKARQCLLTHSAAKDLPQALPKMTCVNKQAQRMPLQKRQGLDKLILEVHLVPL